MRAITDVALLPVVDLLGLQRRPPESMAPILELELAAARGWSDRGIDRMGRTARPVWRASIVDAIGADARWCLCCNGQALRLVDAQRTWSRDYLEFDLALLGREPEAQSVLWTVARAGAFFGKPPLLDTAVTLSRQPRRAGMPGARCRRSRALEVLLAALTRSGRQPSAAALWEQSLTVLYRVLFLLFAEARGLVPLWHPVYRERYSLETIVTTLLEGRPCQGAVARRSGHLHVWRTPAAPPASFA